MSTHTKALGAIIIAACLWGSAGVVAKLLLVELSPFAIITYRFLGSTLLLLPFVHVTKHTKSFWMTLVPISMLNSANVLFIFLGLDRTTALAGSIIGSTTPLVTLILSSLLIGERSSKREMLGIFLGLAGAGVIALLPALQTNTPLNGDLVGNIYIILSVISWALYAVFARKLLAQKIYAPREVAFVNFLTGGIIAFLCTIVSGEPLTTPAMWSPYYLGLLAFAIVGLTLVTFSLFSWAIQHIQATTASLKDYIQLAVGVFLASVILNEQLSSIYFVGAALVFFGVFVATGKKLSDKFLRR